MFFMPTAHAQPTLLSDMAASSSLSVLSPRVPVIQLPSSVGWVRLSNSGTSGIYNAQLPFNCLTQSLQFFVRIRGSNEGSLPGRTIFRRFQSLPGRNVQRKMQQSRKSAHLIDAFDRANCPRRKIEEADHRKAVLAGGLR